MGDDSDRIRSGPVGSSAATYRAALMRYLQSSGREAYGIRRRRTATIRVVEGDLLAQHVQLIVNPWHRNVVPWWLVTLRGIAADIRQRAGVEPFRELARLRTIPLGEAVLTNAGSLPFAAIVHVAVVDIRGVASEETVRASVSSALRLASEQGFRSIAFPLIGTGPGGLDPRTAERVIDAQARDHAYRGEVVIVRSSERTTNRR